MWVNKEELSAQMLQFLFFFFFLFKKSLVGQMGLSSCRQRHHEHNWQSNQISGSQLVESGDPHFFFHYFSLAHFLSFWEINDFNFVSCKIHANNFLYKYIYFKIPYLNLKKKKKWREGGLALPTKSMHQLRNAFLIFFSPMNKLHLPLMCTSLDCGSLADVGRRCALPQKKSPLNSGLGGRLV